MANAENGASNDREKLDANIARIEALSQRLMNALASRRPVDIGLSGPSSELYMKAGAAFFAELLQNPGKIIEQQAGYWGKALKHYVDAQHMLAQGKLAPPVDNTPKDRRFTNPLWDTHPWFNYVKQQYLISSAALEEAVRELELEPRDRRKLEYFTRQILDLYSPTNFLGTNPDALERAVETGGESLVKGLENLVRDIESNNFDILVTLSDKQAFTVGENIATAKGSVVYRNRMFELIQYAPTTEQVHATPMVLFPPWINKFYILDLKPQNSLIRWIVDQGYTLFVVSWVNPDESYTDAGIDTYVKEGYLEAIQQARAITGQEQVNAIGYCIGGTVLALTLALMARRNDKSVKAATFFTTLTDFSDQGEFAPYLDEDFLGAIEREVAEKGILHSFFMSRTFSYMRANDLVYAPAIRSYMMGESPPAFDLLFWNGDSTNLPARMTVEYLRWLFSENRFARGEFELDGEKLKISDIKVPLFAIACQTDHIAAWKSSFDGIRQMGSREKHFVLSESGHIAGVVNPPSKGKYGHYSSAGKLSQPENWLNEASFTPGSWWGRWEEWVRGKSGTMVAPRVPGNLNTHPELAAAPGLYVSGRKD